LEEDIYEDWCAEERERLSELYLNMLEKLAQCYARKKYFSKALSACRSALACEPCREYFHRALMIYLSLAGQRELAIAHYRICQQVLLQELGVEPMKETQQTYRQILHDNLEVTLENASVVLLDK